MADYGFVGTGAIAAAMVEGLAGGDDPPAILLSPRNAGVAADLAGRFPRVAVAADNQAVLDGSACVVLAVRPGDADAVLAPLRFRADHQVVSVMAGVPLARLAPLVAPAAAVARSIPLVAVSRREGNVPVFPPGGAAAALFRRLGTVIELADEAALETFSAVSGTVAAYFAQLDAVAGWMADRGVPVAAARGYVAATFAGLTPELAGAPDFLDLARRHQTPGGINEAFRDHLAAAGLPGAVADGLDRLLARLTAPPG